jgi:hypothetical protein
MLKAAESSTLLPVRIELVIERNISCKSEFSWWRKAQQVLLKRKTSVLESGDSSTLFLLEI